LTDTALSLRRKIGGPNARPIVALVAEGERGAARACTVFSDFLSERLADLRHAVDLLLREPHPARRLALLFIAQDLRSSAATAGRARLSGLLSSLEGLTRQDKMDADILALHLDAMSLAMDPALPEADYQNLLTGLARAIRHRLGPA